MSDSKEVTASACNGDRDKAEGDDSIKDKKDQELENNKKLGTEKNETVKIDMLKNEKETEAKGIKDVKSDSEEDEGKEEKKDVESASEKIKEKDNNSKDDKESIEEDSEGEIVQKTKNSSAKKGKEENIKEQTIDENSESGEEESESEHEESQELGKCRARKKVQRLEISFTPSQTKKSVEIPEGKGQKLGDCPRIEKQLQKMMVSDLKILHRIIFNKAGAAAVIKKNLRQFCGFPFSEDSSEFNQKKDKLQKLTKMDLTKICKTLDIESSGTKETVVNRVLEFLCCPKDSGKSVTKKSSGKGKKKVGKKDTVSKKKTSKTAGKEDEDENDSDIVDKSDESGEEDEKDDEKVSDDKNNDNKDTKKSKGFPKIAPKVKATKKEKAKKVSTKGTKRKKDISESDDSDSDGEPLAKKYKMPSDDEIKTLITSLLKKANLDKITMKNVIQQVFDAYPGYDLSHKREFIKEAIKSVIIVK